MQRRLTLPPPFLPLPPALQGPWVPYSTPLHIAAAKGNAALCGALLAGWAQQAQRAQQRGAQPWPDPRTM